VRIVLRGGTVLGPDGERRADVVVADGRIEALQPGSGTSADAGDVRGLLVAPGLVDLQCNGAVGIDLTAEPERLWEVAEALPRWGVTSWLPTIVTSPPRSTERALAALRAGPPAGIGPHATPLGLHLEGPFLAPVRRGAHPLEHLAPIDPERAARWSRAAGVALVTLAPELPGAPELIAALAARGVVVSLGHSDATADQATAGVEAGARWVTHLFNGMGPLHHRSPGLAGVALADERLRVGLIADLIHVHPTALRLAWRALGERLVLVTDATSALGARSSGASVARGAATVGDDGVRLPDGTLAGTDLSLDAAVRNLARAAGCSVRDAVHAATAAPAAVLGAAGKGRLVVGADADLVVLTPEGHVVATYVGGELAHDVRGSRQGAGPRAAG
jgi:N-acetylglucosamine-6-phosphate deacetylase